MILAMLVLDIIPEFRLDNIPLDTIPFSLWTLLISFDPAMNIAGAETLHVRFKNTVKTSKLTTVTFFFPITAVF